MLPEMGCSDRHDLDPFLLAGLEVPLKESYDADLPLNLPEGTFDCSAHPLVPFCQPRAPWFPASGHWNSGLQDPSQPTTMSDPFFSVPEVVFVLSGKAF